MHGCRDVYRIYSYATELQTEGVLITKAFVNKAKDIGDSEVQ